MAGKLIGSILIALLLQLFAMKAVFCQEDLRLETWAENLKNEKVLIRKSAAKYLGALGDKRAIPPLLVALKDPEAEVRSEVCAALGLFGEESVKETLTNVLYKDPSPMVRFAAKTAIEKIDTYISLQKEKKIKEMKEKLKSSS